jgi:hypothetical protein
MSLIPKIRATYLSLPLIVNILELEAPENADMSSHRVCLYFILEIFKASSARYEAVEYFVLMIQKLLKSFKLRATPLSPQSSLLEPGWINEDLMSLIAIARCKILDSDLTQSGFQTSWWDIFTRHPQLYLRFSFCLNYILSRGHFPHYDELPPLGRDLYSGEVSLLPLSVSRR